MAHKSLQTIIDKLIVELNEGSLEETTLCKLSKKHGSNKHSHKYTHIYDALFKGLRDKKIKLLEIGIGTHTRKGAVSSMSCDGKSDYLQGGSLRRWREYFKTPKIYGIDIEEDYILEEEGIKTLIANPSQMLLESSKYAPYDIIIDDANHLLGPTYITLSTMKNLLSNNGIYIIEDVWKTYKELWDRLLQELSLAIPDFNDNYQKQWLSLEKMTSPSNESQNLIIISKTDINPDSRQVVFH